MELVGAKIFYSEHTFAYPSQSFRSSGGPEAFTSATVFEEFGVKTGSGWTGTLHPEYLFGATLPTALNLTYVEDSYFRTLQTVIYVRCR